MAKWGSSALLSPAFNGEQYALTPRMRWEPLQSIQLLREERTAMQDTPFDAQKNDLTRPVQFTVV